MSQYKEEHEYLETFKMKLASHETISQNELTDLMVHYEELVELASVSMNIIDRLMINYDQLKSSLKKQN